MGIGCFIYAGMTYPSLSPTFFYWTSLSYYQVAELFIYSGRRPSGVGVVNIFSQSVAVFPLSYSVLMSRKLILVKSRWGFFSPFMSSKKSLAAPRLHRSSLMSSISCVVLVLALSSVS